MNLKQMEYFVAAAEQLNFTRAAKKCFISQTAMTLQIRSLEEKIGVPLFVRDKHHVELTAAGKVYLNEARAILVRAEEAAKLARTAAEGVAGELTIGFIRGYEQSRFSETLRSFHEAYPNISIHLLRENMSALYELLDNGTCDLAFNLSLYTQNYEDLKHRFLKRFPMMAVLYPGHTLAGESHLMYRDLAREDFIIMQPQGRSNDEAEEVLICYNKGGFIPNIVARERRYRRCFWRCQRDLAWRFSRNMPSAIIGMRGIWWWFRFSARTAARKNLILRSHGVRATRIRRLKSCCSGWRRMSTWSK